MADQPLGPASRQQAEALAGVGAWTIDLATGVLTTNLAARTMLGWGDRPGAPGLQDFLSAVHPEDQAFLAVHTDRLIAYGEPYVVEHRAMLPGGVVLHLRASATAELGGDGGPAVLHGITLDVTGLRRAVQDVEHERDRNRAVLDSLSEGYLLSDGRVLEVNRTLCTITGYGERELVGTGAPYPFWPADQVEELHVLRGRLRAQGRGSAEVELVRKDGSRFCAALTATVLPTDDGSSLWVVLLRDVTEERELARHLERQAATDPLTGVLNSRSFRDGLRLAVSRADDDTPLSLALVDVDHFKEVNDRFGHAVGDEVLIALVQRLVDATAGRGTVARVGGEEFAVLMPGLEASQAHGLLAEALQALRGEPLPHVGTVTASAGVAQWISGMDDDALFRLADALLYEAKSRGRDQVR